MTVVDDDLPESVVEPEPPPRSSRRAVYLTAALVSVPFVVAIVSVIGQHWFPSFDQALSMLRIRAVGTKNTPLLGAWSRWGWSHPGPALFWVLAPFNRLFG